MQSVMPGVHLPILIEGKHTIDGKGCSCGSRTFWSTSKGPCKHVTALAAENNLVLSSAATRQGEKVFVYVLQNVWEPQWQPFPSIVCLPSINIGRWTPGMTNCPAITLLRGGIFRKGRSHKGGWNGKRTGSIERIWKENNHSKAK